MKKLLLSAAAVFAFTYANAQETTSTGGFSTGDVFISGSVGFGSEKTGDFKTNEFNFSPRVGYFVSENIALGVALGYSSVTADEEFAGLGIFETKTTAFEVGAFGRYYFMPSNQFSLFTQLGVNYGTAKLEVDSEEVSKVNGFNVEFAPGVSYFISEHFALEASFGILSYTTVKPDADDADSTNTFQFGLDMSDINLGLVYKF